MSKKGGHVNIASSANEEHDHIEYRKRVATYVDGDTVSYEDINFVTGDSPIVFDTFTDLGRICHEGYIINDGSGDILVEFSTNGTDYGGQHTLKSGEQLVLNNLKIKKIKLTWVADSAYRVLVA